MVRQKQISELCGSEITDAENTANVIASLIEKKVKGEPTKEQIMEGFKHTHENFNEILPYDFFIKDGRDIYTHSIQLHQFYKGNYYLI